MPEKLYTQTVSKALLLVLKKLMIFSELRPFRLVGGTALSLQLGHRVSIDIDMFTDALYGDVDFDAIDKKLRKEFDYVETSFSSIVGPGRMYSIGDSPDKAIKLDLFYTDPFAFPIIETEAIRMADLREIAAMKLEIVARSGRKKDFWDIIELSESFTPQELLSFFKLKYPYIEVEDLHQGLQDFEQADHEVDPNCLKGRYWELVKADILELAATLKKG